MERQRTRECPDALALKRPDLDVASGCASVEVAKCLLEFHDEKPSRGRLNVAISIGNRELVRLVVGRLPESELEHRSDLAEGEGDPLRLVAPPAAPVPSRSSRPKRDEQLSSGVAPAGGAQRPRVGLLSK